MKRVITLITLLLVTMVAGSSPALAKPDASVHCDGAADANKQEGNPVLPAGTTFCIKGGNTLPTYGTADGVSHLQSYHPYDISYYVVYFTPFVPTYDVSASIIICQDPRAVITLTNDSNVARSFYVRFVSAKTGEVRIASPVVQAESERTIKRWVKGQTMVIVRGEEGERLASVKVNRANNVGACPVEQPR